MRLFVATVTERTVCSINTPTDRLVTIANNFLPNASAASALTVAYTNPNFRNAYIEDFNLNVQQALPWGMTASLCYCASVGRHLLISTNANQANGPTATPSPRPYLTLSPNSPIRPGASINSNIAERNSISSSNYNGLWATISKSMSHGLQFSANYEWTKSMDINSLGSQGGANLEDSNNPALNYGLSDFDVRHHFAATAIYALPFHRNRFVEHYGKQL